MKTQFHRQAFKQNFSFTSPYLQGALKIYPLPVDPGKKDPPRFYDVIPSSDPVVRNVINIFYFVKIEILYFNPMSMTCRDGVLEDVLRFEDVLEDTF